MTTKRKTERGYSLIEMVLYIAILVLMVYVIVNLLAGIVHTRERLNAARSLANSATIALERMTREIRAAASVNVGSSVLGVSPGVLNIDTTGANGAPATIEFYTLNGAVRIRENGIDQGPLTLSNTNVSSLIFTRVASTTVPAESIHIEMVLESGSGETYRTEKFYAGTLMR